MENAIYLVPAAAVVGAWMDRRLRALPPVTSSVSHLDDVMFEEAPIGVALLSMEGAWLRVNREVERITGYTSQELTSGMNWQQITTADTLEADEFEVAKVQSGEQRRYTYEKAYNRKDGERAEVRIHISTTEIAGVVQFLAFIEDLSPLSRRVEQLEERLAAERASARRYRHEAASTAIKLREYLREHTEEHVDAAVKAVRRRESESDGTG